MIDDVPDAGMLDFGSNAVRDQREIWIFDLDGTLRDCVHRAPILGRRDMKSDDRYKLFQSESINDEPKADVIRVALALWTSGADLRVWTGMSSEYRDLAVLWFKRHVHPTAPAFCDSLVTALKMRGATDRRPDHEVKEGWLNKLSDDERRRLRGVFEDRDRVVAMWRRNGVTCHQVCPGSY